MLAGSSVIVEITNIQKFSFFFEIGARKTNKKTKIIEITPKTTDFFAAAKLINMQGVNKIIILIKLLICFI